MFQLAARSSLKKALGLHGQTRQMTGGIPKSYDSQRSNLYGRCRNQEPEQTFNLYWSIWT